MARPHAYTEKLGDYVCEELSKGRSLRAICNDPDIPPESTVRNWVMSTDPLHAKFKAKYKIAREIQADTLVEEILSIADDSEQDFSVNGEGEKVPNAAHILRSRLRVDVRKWFASKVLPKRYGDKLEVSGDPDAPLVPIINISVSRPALTSVEPLGLEHDDEREP